MPEYVYALHNFRPEYDDEVSFHAGELIEVIEKDGMYGDGWWQGRNLAGGIGLFPASYTTPAPRATYASHALPSPEPVSNSYGISTSNSKFILQPLTEESESEGTGINILSLVPKHRTTRLPNGDYDTTELPHERKAFHDFVNGDNEVMKAAMKKAIEQFGRDDIGEDSDDVRSFSFASTRDGSNTKNSDTDFDFDGTGINGNNGEVWRKGARRKLAAKAKRVLEEAEKLEVMMGDNGRRAIAPPIEIDFKEESEVEDGAVMTKSSNYHPHIPEENENVGTATTAADSAPYSTIDTLSTVDVVVPLKDETDIPTATQVSFSASQSPIPTKPLPEVAEEKLNNIYPSPPPPTTTLPNIQQILKPSTPVREISNGLPGPALVGHISSEHNSLTCSSPAPEQPEEKPHLEKDIYPSPIPPPTTTLPNIQQMLKPSSTPVREISNGLPTPAPVGHISSKHNDLTSSLPALGMLVNVQVQQQQPISTFVLTGPASIPMSTTAQGRNETHPMEWSVKEVVDWLKSKGFDQDVCDKFIEQEITGDVLLELDVNLLKSEIGIMAFGKRMRITHAITDFRRPPSIEYSDHQLSPMQLHHSNSLTHSHSRTQSQSQSLPGTTPATTVGHVHLYTMQNSFGSPEAGYGTQQSGHLQDGPVDINDDMKAAGPVDGYGTQQSGHLQNGPVNINHDMEAAGPVDGYGTQQSGHLQDGPVNINDDMKAVGDMGSGTAAGGAAGVGLGGIALSPMNHDAPSERPPPRLLLSSSNAALKESAAKNVSAIAVNGEVEERGHSDGEIAAKSTSIRRRIFGPSHESAVSTMNSSSHSKGLPLSSPIVPEKDNDNVKEKEMSHKDTPIISIQHARSRRSVDAKPADRLSIFTLGKSRKPPPSDDTLTEKVSKFSLLRLPSSSIRRPSSMSALRPPTSNGSPQKGPNGITRIYDKERERSLINIRELSPSNLIPVVTTGINANAPETLNRASTFFKRGLDIMDRIGKPDHTGWMRMRGERFNSWKSRYFILKGPHLYFLKRSETRIKGYILIIGYKVTVDENVDPGRYGFRIDHDRDRTHYFSSDEKGVVRDWMKAIMKATIVRDYTQPVISSCNIPTISLVAAQAMDPAPRPPSPSAREAIQRALRRENTEQLSKRDTRILGLDVTDVKDEGGGLNSPSSNMAVVEGESSPSSPKDSAPPRPSRRVARMNSGRSTISQLSLPDDSLIKWANTHLPESLQITDSTSFIGTGLGLGILRLAESIKGQPCSPPVLDSAFPADIHDDKLDGLFRLFDFLLDGDVKIGSVSINDVRLGRRDKIIQLLKALKAWEDKQKAHALSITLKATSPAAFMLM